MKNFILCLLAIAMTQISSAQSSETMEIKVLNGNRNWLKIENASSTQPEKLIESLSDFLELKDSEELLLLKTQNDDLGIAHYRFQQYYNGVKVEGGEFLIHISSDQKIKANGRLVHGLENSVQNPLSEEAALSSALEYIGADMYKWEDEASETLLKEVKNDNNATYYPFGDLVLSEERHSQDGRNYELNWRFDIYAMGEKSRNIVYVNAIDGSISYTKTGIHSDVAYGTAETRYHGIRDIITDSTGADVQDFILFDDTRGNGGIRTLDALNGYDYTEAVNFSDEDNYWDETANSDNAAYDVHWSAEMTYDYFLEMHDRNSWNGSGALIMCLVHYGENYNNASWDGTSLNFGDAGGNPYASIDVVAHEFSHAVTSSTADLEYSYESGALNESFSDIFGNAVEHFAYEEEFSWDVGILNFKFRDMADPNSEGQPDTYLGDMWWTSEGDNGGVHFNSGVQNHWFYLLSDGGSGVNDNGLSYELDGIGIEDAGKVAYRNLEFYLTSTSEYNDAWMGSVSAAEDVFGTCSNEVRETIKAWKAVGLGGNTDYFFDAEIDAVFPESGCFLGSEPLELIFIYNEIYGCDDLLAEGDTIQMGYRDNGVEFLEEQILSDDMEDWDELYFEEDMDLSATGPHEIEVLFVVNGEYVIFDDPSLYVTINNTVSVPQDESIGFESYEFSPDSFYVLAGEHAEAKISSVADNTGTKGFKMSGFEMNEDLIDWPSDESQNFTTNQDYISKLCFCVDASDWDEVNLAFDMKQLHSEYWNTVFGEDMAEFSSSMRITIDGEQFGDQYHPTTYDDDPYLTYYIDLNSYAGNIFSLCFESKNFLRNAEDPVPGSSGDNTYIDNVRFKDPTVGIEELETGDFSIFPNPNSGEFVIQVSDFNGEYMLSIMDALGREVASYSSSNSSNNSFNVDLSGRSKGIYIVKVQSGSDYLTKRIVVQ